MDSAAEATLAQLKVSSGTVAVAIGVEAVEAARAQLPAAALVFCQVFDYQDLLGAERTWGVQSVPPLGLQLATWKELDSSLQRIGLIVSDAHAGLVDGAMQAASVAAAEVSVAVSASDRETLYLFKRLAPQLDGLWLFPDNRILSPACCTSLDLRATHGIGVLVFNDALLLGSSAQREQHGAGRRAHGPRRDRACRRGPNKLLPSMTPLSRWNSRSIATWRAGSASRWASQSRWVLRDPD